MLLTFIKLTSVITIFVLSIFEWPFNTGFTQGLPYNEHNTLKISNVVNFKSVGKLHSLSRVKSGNLGHQVNSDIHLPTVEIQIRRLLRIFTVCLVIFFIPIIKM